MTKAESGARPTASFVLRRSSFVWGWVALVAWALALFGATAGFALGQQVYERGVVYGDPGPALPDLDGPPRAINTQLELEPDEAALRRSLRLIREAGFGWLRQQFAWANLETGGKGQFYDPGAGRPTWEKYDRIVDLAREAGLRVIARLDLPPDWARPPGSFKSHPPRDVGDYGDFVAAFVDHYRGRIGHIQVWNEPNLNSEWGQRPGDPPGSRPVDVAGYVELLKAGYLGAKRADPAVRVLSGELAQTLEPDAPGANGLDDLVFLDRMYLYGAKPYFDILAANAYGLWTGPHDRQVGARYTNFPRVLLTREVMLRHGDGGKAVWVTEFGWNALPRGWTGAPSPWGSVAPDKQASYVVGAYSRAGQEWPWMGPLALWLFHQPRADPRDPTPYFGLVDAAWQPRPAYEALRASAPAQALGPGVHQESSAGLTFEGTWQWTPDPTASLGAMRESPISGAAVRLRFRGTGLELLAPFGPSRGLAYVKIDGAYTLANRLPRNANGQALVDCYAPVDAPQRRVAIADGLPDRGHEAELVVAGTHAPAATAAGVGIDAFVVSRSRPLAPALALGAAWGLTAAALLWRGRGILVGSVAAIWAETRTAALLEALAVVRRVPWLALGVLAIAASLPFTPLAISTPLGRYPLTELLLAAGAAGVLLAVYVQGRLPAVPAAFAAPAALLVVIGLCSLVVAEYPRLALRELRTLVIEPVVFYFLARAALRGQRGALLLAGAFLAGATAASLLAVGQAVLGLGLVAAEGVARAAALYPSPNNLALLLDRAVPLALALALYARPTAPPPGVRGQGSGVRPLARWLIRYAAHASLAVCTLALLLTFSRGAWLATAVAGGIVAAPWVARLDGAARRRVLVGGALAVPALLGAAALALRFERFRSLLNPQGTGVLRLHVWQAALDMVRDHPLWGVGLDQFLYYYPRYMRPEAWREPNLSHPHNLALDFWLRLGLLGSVALAWLAVLVVRRAVRGWRGAAPAIQIALVIGAGGAALAAALHGLVDNSYFVVDLAYAWWVIALVLELAADPEAPVGDERRDARVTEAG